MAKHYKLTEEIKQFIIAQKKANLKLSCRTLTSLIQERFQVTLSKSLINIRLYINIFHQNEIVPSINIDKIYQIV